MTPSEMIVQLVFCGVIAALSIFMLVVLRRKPRKDINLLFAKQCQVAMQQISRLQNQADNKKKFEVTIVRRFNYAKRLAQEIAYQDDNAISGTLTDHVRLARESFDSYRADKTELRLEALEQCQKKLQDALHLLDRLIESRRRVQSKKT